MKIFFRTNATNFFSIDLRPCRKPPIESIGRVNDDLKSSPLGSGSPNTPFTPSDRAAAKRAELRRLEQERRRREAVCIISYALLYANIDYYLSY